MFFFFFEKRQGRNLIICFWRRIPLCAGLDGVAGPIANTGEHELQVPSEGAIPQRVNNPKATGTLAGRTDTLMTGPRRVVTYNLTQSNQSKRDERLRRVLNGENRLRWNGHTSRKVFIYLLATVVERPAYEINVVTGCLLVLCAARDGENPTKCPI